MSLSRFLSSTSALLCFAACSDDECGPAGAPTTGLVASSAAVTLTFGGLTSLAANDCPVAGTPAGVISVSIEGQQTDGTGLITFCIPRPDQLNDGDQSLGTAISMADLRIIDLRGTQGSCTLTLDSSQPPTGTARAAGVCGNANDAAGFALELDAAVTLRRTCDMAVDSVPVTLKGKVAVAKRG